MISSRQRTRTAFIALALSTIALGLWVHRAAPLGPVARDVLGDVLWAIMMAWWIGALTLSESITARSATAFGICVLVELSQLIHSPWLDATRATTVGHLVLGSGFDPRDIAAYALGVGVAALGERVVRTSLQHRTP